MICDNKNQVHDNKIINEEKDGIRVICTICKKVYTMRIDINGRMNTRLYSKVYKRDIVQPGSNLYYKVYPEKMSLV